MKYLFNLPKSMKSIRPSGKRRVSPAPAKRTGRSQQEKCKRCAGSAAISDAAYCHRFDICIEFDNGAARLANGGFALKCDGKEWSY